MQIRRKPTRPMSPADEMAALAAHPKARFRQAPDPADTSELEHAKIQPDRNRAFMSYLHFQLCSVKGKTDNATGQLHVCWSPGRDQFSRPLSDPAHTSKTGLGMKGPDSGCFPLCRHAHRQQEANMDDFDRRFGINRFEIAREHFERFQSIERKKVS